MKLKNEIKYKENENVKLIDQIKEVSEDTDFLIKWNV